MKAVEMIPDGATLIITGEMEVELCPQGTFVERIREGFALIAAFQCELLGNLAYSLTRG